MKRRDFIALLAGATIAAPHIARAQPSKTFRIGSLTPGMPIADKSPLGVTLLKGLEQRGFVAGKNLTYDAAGPPAKTPSCLNWSGP